LRGTTPALVLAALAAIHPDPSQAEIRSKVRNGEIVATNIGVTRRPLPAGQGPHSAAAGAPVEKAAPVLPAAPRETSQMVEGSAARYGFDPALIVAIVAAESAFDNFAVSKKGARGLMQLMPETARERGVRNAHDPASNVEAGVAYLRELVRKSQGDVATALAAYNAGPEAVARYGGIPPYEETRRYIERIRAYYGDDLDAGDWSRYPGGIRLTEIEKGGVPHFTNVRPRRTVKIGPGGAPSAGQRR